MEAGKKTGRRGFLALGVCTVSQAAVPGDRHARQPEMTLRDYMRFIEPVADRDTMANFGGIMDITLFNRPRPAERCYGETYARSKDMTDPAVFVNRFTLLFEPFPELIEARRNGFYIEAERLKSRVGGKALSTGRMQFDAKGLESSEGLFSYVMRPNDFEVYEAMKGAAPGSENREHYVTIRQRNKNQLAQEFGPAYAAHFDWMYGFIWQILYEEPYVPF